MKEEKLFKKKNKEPKKIPLKLNEKDDYEYLEFTNPYKQQYDSAQGGVSTVGNVEGDSSETKSPIDLKTVRNQYWMDIGSRGGGGRSINCSMITTKNRLQESVKILELLTERDVIVAPSQEQPMEEDPNAEMGMEGEEGMEMEEDPNAEMGMEGEEGAVDPNIDALMQILQQEDPDTIEAVKKYAEGIIKAKGGDEEAPPEEDPNMGMEADPNMGMEADPNMGMEADPNAAQAAQPQQMESRKRNLDEIINDYLDSPDKTYMPTVSKNLGNVGKTSFKSKMYNPINN